jgi:PAS domain S-box-containing protein
MEQLNVELIDIKEAYNYVSEAIIIADEEQHIVFINDTAIEKLLVSREKAMNMKLRDFIPIEDQEAVIGTIQDDDATYFNVHMKNDRGLVFPTFVSGQTLPLLDGVYGILTIVDLTELKKQEEEQLRKLKSHIISQAATHAKKANEERGQGTSDRIALQGKIDELKHEIFKLERKVSLFEKENQDLNTQFDKIQENSFSFEQVLDREIAMAKRYDTKFSLAIVAIHEFKEFTEKIANEYKRDLILRAFKKHFRSTVRTTDVIYYENSGLFYLILPNSADVNITDLVKRLLQSKRIDSSVIVEFDCGISHFFTNDSREQLIYRARKSLEINIKENNVVRSQ